MDFMTSLKKTLMDEYNVSYSENGAKGYKTTGKDLLDLNFSVTSLRKASNDEIIDKFIKAYYYDKNLAMKWLFYVRDVRGGVGERRLFRVIANYMSNNHPEIFSKLIKYIPEYGRFDDMLCLVNTPLENLAFTIMKNQLVCDIKNMKLGKPVSLLAKWLPSPNATSKATKGFAKITMKHFSMEEPHYRKVLVKLRKYIDVVEVKMSNRHWEEINYETVPSRANLIYNSAFLRNDEERRRKFLESLGKGEVKINAGTLFPHDIVHKYSSDYHRIGEYDAGIEGLWNTLPNLPELQNTIVVADGSGSMKTTISGTITALEVANALAIYFAERCKGQFKNKYITFSERPKLVDLSRAHSLKEKLELALVHNEVANTNIEAVFNLILDTAVRNGMSRNELPSTILIISDMEFDQATYTRHGHPDRRLFEIIADRYKSFGYLLPKLAFWNVNSRTKTIPIIENEMGVALVSGFSPTIVKMVMSEKTDPYEALVESLMSERYSQITIK